MHRIIQKIPMSIKIESDQLNLIFFEEIQSDHLHGTINKTPIITEKPNKIEIINKMNLSVDILL